MGRSGVHGLATGHLDDVGFINIQPVVKAMGIERSKGPGSGRDSQKDGERER